MITKQLPVSKGYKMKLVEEGRYIVKPVEWGITQTKEGLPQLFITFEGDFSDEIKRKTWFGSLKEGKAREFALKAICTCGFAYSDLSYIERYDALDKNTEVSVVIGHEEFNGVTRDKIQWVNKIKSLKASSDETKMMLKGMDLKAELMVAMQEVGIKPKTATKSPIQSIDTDEVPF